MAQETILIHGPNFVYFKRIWSYSTFKRTVELELCVKTSQHADKRTWAPIIHLIFQQHTSLT